MLLSVMNLAKAFDGNRELDRTGGREPVIRVVFDRTPVVSWYAATPILPLNPRSILASSAWSCANPARQSSLRPRMEHIEQAIAEQVESKHGQHNPEAR